MQDKQKKKKHFYLAKQTAEITASIGVLGSVINALSNGFGVINIFIIAITSLILLNGLWLIYCFLEMAEAQIESKNIITQYIDKKMKVLETENDITIMEDKGSIKPTPIPPVKK